MSTTSLFVELVVIGVAAFAWVALALITFLGIPWASVESLAAKGALAVPAFTAVYLLGIITDRIADQIIYLGIGERLRNKRYRRVGHPKTEVTEAQFFADRAKVLDAGGKFVALYDYSRSRQRIVRGWTLNAILLAIAVMAYATWGNPGLSRETAGSLVVILVLTAGGCFWALWALMVTELHRIAEHANALKDK